MHEPIIGSEAIDAGTLTRGALRWNYIALLPGVYIHKDARIDTWARAKAAWLWNGRRGVIAGRTAAALIGVTAIDDHAPIEMIAAPRRAQPGVIVRNERIESDEISTRGPPLRANAARTALDIARRLPLKDAIVVLDQLAAIGRLTLADVEPLEHRYQGARGMWSAYEALRLMDGGTRSPEESLLRLALIKSGLPRPQTSIEIADDPWEVVLGMGWPDARVAVEWGPHRRSLIGDVDLRDLLTRLGWQLIEALPHRSAAATIRRCEKALWRSRVRRRATG